MEKKYFDEETITGESFVEILKDGYEYIDCVFRKCDFSYGVLYDCRFEDCVFENCNFSMTKMDKCVHNHSKFQHCKLQGIAFEQCAPSMFHVGFEHSSLSYTSFVGMKIPKTIFQNSELKAVDFTNSDLSNSKFEKCELPDCIFNQTILNGADFSTANQFRIDPENNRIKYARFDMLGLPGLLDKYGIVII